MNIKKILASVLCVSIFTLYTPIGVLASEISGVNPNGNTYNIEASKVSGSTGFRHYDKFDLSQGDIANLIYKNYDKFVNLVNSQISINGILNTINANGKFFNGHAIFVSPLGMVIGASGVLNVGSLSVLTPSQSSYNDFLNSYNAGNLSDYQYNADKYRGLITDSQGDVIVKGKILARNDVNIYGKSISVGDNAVKNSGIVAGWQDTKTVIKEQQLAEKTFNALVSNNITNANSLSLKNGKIVLSATSNPDLSVNDISTASVDVKNTKLIANDVDISANTTMEQVYFKEGRAKVNVENSKIVGDNVSIVANAIANTSKNINLMPPAIWAWLFENEGNISEYFSSKIYNGFSGTRTSANVTIKDSIINATNDINILSKAESSLAVNSDIVSQGGVPQLFYALGTRTNSKINIDNSTLNAKNDVNLNALSKNAIDVKMIDNSDYIFKIKTQDAYHATILKASTIADTAINITNGSKILANNFNAKSLAYGTGEFNLTNTATVGKNDFGSSSKGGSGAAFIYFMNDSDTSSEVNIKDSIIETTGNSDISATNLNGNGTWVTIQTNSKGYKKPDTIQDSDGFFTKLVYYLGKAYDKYTSVTTVDMTQMFKNVFGKAQENIAEQVNQNVELGMANFQAGGGVVVNNSTGNAQVNIENSKIKTKDLKVEAYNLDQYYNNSSVSATPTEGGDKESAIVGAGVAVVVNNHENTSKVSIKNSTINADNVVANAINDLPGNHGHFGISNKYFKLGFDFNASADDAWSFEPVAKLEGESINMVPEFGLFGFFNNFASASSSGDKQAVSASIVYNTTKNNADTIIENSTINAKNSVVANAVNAVVARDAVGFLNSDSIINIGSIFEIFNSNGLGGNVIVQKITNNANAKIIDSNVKVENGDLTLASANQQSYLNIATIGGQSEKMTINGTVNVQNINGKTNALITNSNVSANNVNVNAGKAKVALSKNGAELNDNDELEKAEEKDVNDKVSNLVINGVLSDQKSSEAVSASAAFGAAVNVQSIDRTIHSAIEDSIVNANNDVNVISSSITKTVDLAMGASFAGGKSMGKGAGAGAGEGANIGVGNADEIIDDAVSEAGSMDVNIGDVEDVANVNDQGDNALDALREGVNASSNQLSIAAVGSVNVLTDKTNTKSNITNSTINVGKNLNIKSSNDKFAVMGAGGIAKSGKIGGGAGVNVYTDKGSSKALIDGNSTVNFAKNNSSSSLNISATNTNTIYNVAAGVGIASDSNSEGVSGALGGSFAINTIKPTVEAMIIDSIVNGNSKTNVSLNTLGKVDIVDIAGGLSANNTKGLSIGASIASSVNLIKGNILSQISNSKLQYINDLSVIADAQNDLFTLDIAAALATSDATSSFNFDGAVGVDYFENVISSKILGSTVDANGNVDVKALSTVKNTNSAGVAQYSGAQNPGLGVNGNVIVNIHRNILNTTVDKNSKIKAKNVSLLSKSIETSILTPVGFAISGRETSMLAANINYNLNKNDITSTLSGVINADNNVNVLAFDEATLYSRGGTLAFVNSGQSSGAISGAVNIDKFKKNISAKIEDATINANNDVVVTAQSINSIGGTKKDDGSYDLPDITSSNYKDLVKSDGTGYNSSFENWNMFYSLAGGGKVSGGGTVIIKNIENTVSANVSNSTIKSKSLTAVADDYSIKNIVVGMVQALGDVAIGASVLIVQDKSTVSSVIDGGSDIEVKEDVNVIARNKKDNHFITAMLGFGTKGTGGANVVLTSSNDKTVAKIEGSSTKRTSVNANELNVKASTDTNSTSIGFIGSGSSNFTFNIEPTVNDYKNNTFAYINYGDIKNAKIDINAHDKIDSLNILASIVGSVKGFAGSGLILKNHNRNSIKGYIENSIIDTKKDINIDANSVIDTSNYVVSGGFAGTGATLLVNFIINNIVSDLESGIKNSEIKNSGNISILANKDVKDDLFNVAGSVGITGLGLTAETNLIYNLYKNKITTYFDNVGADKIASLNLEAYADRNITNKNYGITATAKGVSLLVDAIVNEVDSTVYSYVDAKENTINSDGDINILANDLTTLDNEMAFISFGAVGAGLGANVNLINVNNTVKAEILSATNGSINARNVNVNSENILALKSLDVAIAGGLGAASVDVLKITLGKRTGDFDELETNNGTKEVIDTTLAKYTEATKNDEVNGLYTTTSAKDVETGAVSRISGNVNASNNVIVKAFSKLKGKDSDTLKITNVPVTAGAVAIGVGVQAVNIANNTIAEISNAKVTSKNGNVEVNAESKNDVSIVNTDVTVGGLAISGASGTYKNTSETVSKIADSDVSANNVEVISKLSNKADIWDTAVIVSGASVGVAVSDATDLSKTIAMITGNTNIDAKGDLNVHATGSSDMSAVLRLTSVSGAKLCSYIKNNATANTLTEAIIKDVNGNINTGNLNIIADLGTMSVLSRANVVSVSGLSYADIGKSGAYLTSTTTAGVDSKNTNLVINNKGTTNIKSGVKASDNTAVADLIATAKIMKTGVSMGGNIYASSSAIAENNATVNAYLLANEHNADNLNLIAKSNAIADAIVEVVDFGTVLNVSSATLNSTLNNNLNVTVGGKNNIKQTANIIANNVSTNKTSMDFTPVGVAINVGTGTLNANLNSNTNVTLGGEYNSTLTNVDVRTVRHSILDLTSSSGSFISVANATATNNVGGDSVLNIDGFNSSSDSENRLNIITKTDNTLDTMTINNSGGFIAVSNVNPTTSLNTSNTLNIKNSNINSQKDVNLSVENTNTVIDSASLKNGGFVAVAKTGVENTYTTNANLNIENSTINAKNVNLNAKASTISGGDMLSYVGKGGGFVASTKFDVENNLNQNASISLKNSKVRARENLKVNLLTKTFFRQKTATSAGGFTAAPVNSNTLTVKNTNKLSLDKNSLLKSDDKLLINFDSNDTLYAYSESYASHFGFSSPSSNSVIDLTINNMLDNSGSIQGGESVEINMMKDSYSDLYQYAYSEANAAIPTTNESGRLSKTVSNIINVNKGANITSGGDINIRYSAGRQSLFSKIAYTTVCRILFGIPITSRGSKSNISTSTDSRMSLNGEIVAGAGNMKYMKINRDGSVDFSTSTFNDDEYTLVDNRKITEAELREKDRISLNADINEIDVKIESLDTEINNTNKKISEVDSKIEANEKALNELNNFKDNMKSESEMSEIVEENIKTKIIDSGKIDEEKYDSLTSAYDKKCSEIQKSNLEKMEKGDKLEEIPSFKDFLKDQKDELGVSDEQIATINNICDKENAKIVSKKIADSEYIIYDEKILVLRDKENPITSLETENKALKDTKAEYEKIASSYDSEKTLMANKKDTLQKTLDDLPNKKYDVQDKEYSIIFNDVKNKSSLINISGISPSSISGNGNIRVASSGMKIDNYSNRSLIFSSIDLVSSYKSGLYINNDNFSAFLNKPQAINNAYAYLYLRGIKSLDDVPTDGVHYISGYGSGEQSGITISNYYDNTNPFASSEIASDIFFTSSVKSNGELDVWNESGDIMALGDIDANKTSLIASKGEVISITAGDFKLKGNDNYIYGGKGISIFANNIDVSNVDMVAGTSSRDITITDDMLNDLIVDPTTGEKNMINLGSTNKSPYLNENNNIKAIYKNGEIYLFDVEQTGGEISLVANGTVSLNPNGTYKTSEGYQTINITNETSKVLNVGSISNAKFKGGIYENLERRTDVGQNNLTESGEVSISSIGNVNINKNIINNVILNEDNTYSQDNQDGSLIIYSKNDVTTNGEIRNSGLLSITNDNGEMNIAGNIYNNGYLSILKDGNGDTIISSIIENSDGDLHISSSGSGDTRITSAIRNINGTLNITKYGNGNALISAIIENTNGDLNISNAGVGDLSILKEAVIALNKDNTDQRGNITITNKAKTQGDLIIASEINNYGIGDVNISVEKDSSALLNIINNVRANEGNIKLSNMGDKGISIGNSVVEATKGDVIITNENGGINISSTGLINTKDGNISLTNKGQKGINLDGKIKAEKQDIIINNGNDGINISSTGSINTKDGNINLTNKGKNGLNIKGIIKADNKNITIDNENSNIVIGEYDSDNDNYIQTLNGDVVINQTNGSILNGIIDAVAGNNHSNYDLKNPNKAYKTLISTSGRLTLNVVDGNIGESKLDSPAFSIDAKTRDYTDSINVNVGDVIIAKALNKNSNAKRLINLRAKDSDLSIKRIEADGDVVLTAIDWKQGDLRPTPKNDGYYKGYSILSYSDFNQPAIIGQNISLIASDNIGTSYKPLTYLQDTLNAPNSSLSAEAENNIYLDSRVNSSNPAKIYQLISKRGNVDLNFDIDMEIGSIVSGKNLHIISTAKNLTIYEIGNIDSEMLNFEDVLYPHDNILATSKEHCIPESIDIEVLDINGGDNANSTLKIYTAFVRGRNNGKGAYYEDDGTRMDDVFLMADNIYANSDKASNGVNSEREYSEGVFGGDSSKTFKAKGINAYGNGAILSLDVRGVNKDLVEFLYPSATRTNYKEQLQVQSPFSKFMNKYALITDINYVDYRANNIALSINDYAGSRRNAQINTIIADKAFVNTSSDTLNINEGYIGNYAEFKNSSKLAIIDNVNKQIYDNADIQLFTKKTGSFNLFMNKSININTTAGTVYHKPNILVNAYHSAWTLVERCQKESKNADDRIDMKQAKSKNSDTVMNTKSLAKGVRVEQNSKLTSDTQILNISSTGAIVKDNGKMKVGKYSTLTFNIDDEDVVVKVKVESSDNGFVNVRFVDVPEEVINKILYMNMLKADNN